MKLLSGILVGCFGIFLIGLSVLCIFLPSKAEKFLASFASSARAHYLEIALRLIVGAGLILFAVEMWFPTLFLLFGWVIVVTSIGLLLIPWRLHHKFSRWTIPQVFRYLNFFALGAFALGAFIFYGMSRIVFPS